MSGGPARREMRNTAMPEVASLRATRDIHPGKVTMASLKGNIGLEESKRPTYTNDESVLFENTSKVRRLVEEMERKEVKKDET